MVILLLKAGPALPEVIRDHGDFETLFAKHMGLDTESTRVLDMDKSDAYPNPREISGVIIMGSHHMVSERRPWMDQAADWLRDAVGARVPTLGVCFGHQLLAYAFGGNVNLNPRGLEMGAVDIRMTREASDDPLFGALPARFAANVTHYQSVLRLPRKAVRMGESDLESNQAFRLGENAWGVQFHPEFNAGVMREYIVKRADELAAQGKNVEAMLEQVRPVDQSHNLLVRFLELARL